MEFKKNPTVIISTGSAKGAKDIATAKDLIGNLELDHYFSQAVSERRISIEHKQEALNQYRQFLLLLWCAHDYDRGVYFYDRDRLLAPSGFALAIWYKHRDDGVAYAQFCNNLVGKMIYLEPCLIRDECHGSRAKETSTYVQRYYCKDGGKVDVTFSDYYLNER